jgi:hypothetical protein
MRWFFGFRLDHCGGVGLFFLGHMAWAYVWAVAFAGKGWKKLFVPAVFVLAVLPDLDLFLWDFGVEHHTFMHSLFFWLVLFMPFLVIYRLKVIPYFVAVVQHFAFGDFLVGEVMLFWPFSFSYFGLNTAMMSVFDVGLEVGGLLLALGVMYFNGDLRRLLSMEKGNVWMFFPFLALVASMLFFAVDLPILPLVYHIGQSRLFAGIVLGHLVLVGLLAVSAFQGLRKLGDSF